MDLRENFEKLIAEGRTGFTLDITGTEYRQEQGGYAVGIRRCRDFEDAVSQMKPHIFLGWWRTEQGEAHIDLVQIYAAKATAFVAAYILGEICIYDFANDELIDCTHFYQEGKSHEKDQCSPPSPAPEAVQERHEGQGCPGGQAGEGIE